MPVDLKDKRVRIKVDKDTVPALRHALEGGKEVWGQVIRNPPETISQNNMYSLRLDEGHSIEGFSRPGPDGRHYVDLPYACLEVF